MFEVQINRIRGDLETVNSYNSTPGQGITRFTFSEEYVAARSYIIEELRKIGAYVTNGIAGNLRGRLEGTEREGAAVMMGSHIDTVLHGGQFDGLAGVVAALEAARTVVEKRIQHRLPIDVVVFAEEEGSRFQSVMLGSRAWIGKLKADELGRIKDRDGVSYLEAMDQAKIVPDASSILTRENTEAMLEMHIEQSVVLERKGISVGVVEAIAGIKQFLVTIHGVSNHAGGTPMSLRHDALQGAARIISAVEEIAVHQVSNNTVATVGFVKCEPGQTNVIPGRVEFTLDIRDTESKFIDMAVNRVKEVISATCGERGMTYEIRPGSDTPPAVLSRNIVGLIEEIARKKQVETLRMMSGALHDSSILSEVTEVGMIFVPSKQGRSHCPEEHTNLEHIKLGADILMESAIELAS